MIEQKNCKTCGSPVKGRSDKKFCNDYCRNTYNNQLNADANSYVRNINSILRKNRKILENLLSQNTTEQVVKREHMLRDGFNFDHFTHLWNKNGKTYLCCYEYAYVLVDDATICICRTC